MRPAALLMIALLTAACGEMSMNVRYGDRSSLLVPKALRGTPEEVGILRMLNDPETGAEQLDHEARLEARAASGLIQHRNGKDAVYPSPDDDLYDDLVEVDAVPYVGPSALDRLLDYAYSLDFVPGGRQYLGTYDGVAFTAEDAEGVLRLVNTASPEALDVEVGLDRRAVQAIVGARPLFSVQVLSELFYVGAATLERLKAASAAPAEGRACAEEAPCGAALSCVGIPLDGSGVYGRCVDPRPRTGEGAGCGPSDACGAGLACAGLTAWDRGVCVPEWMQGVFRDDGLASIPDGSDWGTGASVPVFGLAPVLMDVVVDLTVRHPAPGQLVLILTDPAGRSVDVIPPLEWAATGAGRIVIQGLTGQAMVNGLWTLRVVDRVKGGEGLVDGWGLELTTRWD